MKATRGNVYVLTTPDGKEYVGQTAGPMWQRLVRHRRDTLRDPERPICAAFLQHGQAAIKVTVVASGIESREERAAIEARLIADRNTLHPNGLNMLPRDRFADHLHTPDVVARASAGKREFFKNNPEHKARAVAKMQSGFNPEQARALCVARNADPELQAKAHEARRKTLGTPEGRARIIAAGARRAKLKPEMLDDILLALVNGESKASLGKRYGVTQQAITQFVKRNQSVTA